VTRLLPELYDARFDEREISRKDDVWREIVAYLERYIDKDGPTLDVGCDRGHFIRFVATPERWATDIRDMRPALPPEVTFVQGSGLDLTDLLPNGHFATVFMSNYLEHLESSDAVIDQLRVVRSLLRPGGRVIVLQPNIRLVGGRYWDFIDHRVPLTERSLVEAGDLAGLRTVKLITRFLPFTTKSVLPQSAALVRMYLALPIAWRVAGRQTLYVAERPR